MVRTITALLLVAAPATGSLAQELPPAPVPVMPAAPPPDGPITPAPRLLPVVPPAPAILSTLPPVVYHEPPVERGQGFVLLVEKPPCWFASIEADIVKPHLKNRLQGRVELVDQFGVLVRVPPAELDWTVAPRFELGYRLPDGRGEFLVSYRFLVSEGRARGNAATDVLLTDGALLSRLDLNVIDLDYAQRACGPGSAWDLKWRVGVRVANVFFDARREVRFVERETAFSLIAGERTSNYFIGAGPHVGFDLWRRLGTSDFALFGRVEGALVVGRINQTFEETLVFSDAVALGGASSANQTQAVPVLNVQAGLGWAPAALDAVRFAVGYQYEHWWYLGQVGPSRAELWDQGVFFRGEYRY